MNEQNCLNCGQKATEGEEIDLIIFKGIVCAECIRVGDSFPDKLTLEYDDGTTEVLDLNE